MRIQTVKTAWALLRIWLALKLIGWGEKVMPPAPQSRRFELDGVKAIPFPDVKTLYARPLSAEEQAQVAKRAQLGLREEAQA